MSQSDVAFPAPSPTTGAPSLAQRWMRSALEHRLGSLERSCIEWSEGGDVRVFGPRGASARATVEVRSPGFFTHLLREGSLGAARSYIDGDWDTDDLSALLRIVLREPALFGGLDGPAARLASGVRRLLAPLERNTRRGSRRNISAHYDLGNALFERMLDPSMTYSSAVFASPDATLEEAQAEKYDRICRRLGIGPGHRVLEIGTGWGGFALHASQRRGAHVTTTTISREQHAWAADRFAKSAAPERVELLFQDYRDLVGTYDRLVSIEMIEAVGHEYLDGYLRTCSDRLAHDGAMSIQAIVIGDQGYEAARRHVDFIKQYIFPGGCLPSIARIADGVASETDLRICALEDITAHYAETLRRWRARFDAAEPELRALGCDDAFLRTWRYYLSYCEAGFEERHISCVQMDLVKPGWRPQGPLSTPSAG